MEYIEKLDLQTEEVKEVETLEKHKIIISEPFSVNKYKGHTDEFLAVDGDYNDGFNQLNETNGLGISCIVSKEVKEARIDVNGNAYTKLKDRIDSEVNEIKSSLQHMVNNNASSKIVNRNLFGQKNNACILNINNSGRDADILGGDKTVLASYPDRDIVNIYSHMEAPQGVTFNSSSFTVDSITVPNGINLENIKEGMIIDCYPNNNFIPTDKYSGYIERTEGQNIYVSGWFKTNNNSSGQIPTTDYNYIVINGATKTWVVNYNSSLVENSIAKKGIIAEYGLFNSKSATDSNARVDGVDVVNFKGKTDFGFKARVKDVNSGEMLKAFESINTQYGFYNSNSLHTGFKNAKSSERGFCNDDSKTGFLNLKSTDKGFHNVNSAEGFVNSSTGVGFKNNGGGTGFLNIGTSANTGIVLQNDSGTIGFKTTGNGLISQISYKKEIITSDTTADLNNNAFLFISGNRNVILPNANLHNNKFFKVFSTGASILKCDVVIKGATSQTTTYNLEAYKMYELFSDGTNWFIAN